MDSTADDADGIVRRAAESENAAPLLIDTDKALAEERRHLELTKDEQPVALCLSGGGIRSATFCLGVLQELARQGLLDRFHYLSTVSGGGYIGAWLTRVISSQLDADPSPDARVPMDRIGERITRNGKGPEPGPVRNLRRFSNFLTPNPGLASLDTWTGALLWIRNTALNWLVFIPVFVVIVTVPILYFALSAALLAPQTSEFFDYVLGTLAALCLVWACYRTMLSLPSHSHPDDHPAAADRYGPDGRALFRHVVVPVLIWCYVAPIAVTAAFKEVDRGEAAKVVFMTGAAATDAQLPPICPSQGTCGPTQAQAGGAPSPLEARFTLLPLASLFGGGLAYALAYSRLRRRPHTAPEARHEHLVPFRNSWPAWIISCTVSAALTWYGIWLARDLDIFWLTLAGPIWIGVAEVLRTTLYVALRKGGLRAELDREWLARLNAVKLMCVLPAAVIGTAAIVGGLLTSCLATWGLSLAAAGGITAGSGAAFLGRSAWTTFTARDANPPRRLPVQGLIGVGIVLFALTLLILFGRAVAVTAGALAALAADGPSLPSFWAVALATLLILLGAGATAYGLGLWINLNRFSMHAVYRNRLVRAFLGSARPEAENRPDRFTQFDPYDNLRMADAFDHRRSRPVLFPVINVALNRTSGKDTARAERKAESFTITPLRCGAASLCGPEANRADKATWKGAYIRTSAYAGDEKQTGADDQTRGISLGTAITISGAAASPNMGYHSSPLIAFIMTLFNVRLGAWLPNPGAPGVKPTDLKQPGPRNGLWTLLAELAGRSDRNSGYLYLSDGGHFDNLGLYEMLRRRCKSILVIDASQDETYGYEDLGRTVQHALVDMGIAIDFDPIVAMRANKLTRRGALGTIRYPDDGTGPATGRLLYLKPWMPEDLGVEITSFQVRKESFPHVSTGNQFFAESDFEAYRHLGEAIMRIAIEGAPKADPSDPQPLIERLFLTPAAGTPPAA